MGGMKNAIMSGFPQGEIADAAYRSQLQLETARRVMVGVNKYIARQDNVIPYPDYNDQVEIEQKRNLQIFRKQRDSKTVKKHLDEVRNACRKGINVMSACIDAVKNQATLQEICDVYREIFGESKDPAFY